MPKMVSTRLRLCYVVETKVAVLGSERAIISAHPDFLRLRSVENPHPLAKNARRMGQPISIIFGGPKVH
jgi:hypothetical protein